MSITIASKIADFQGQCIERVKVTEGKINIHCRRDKRFRMCGGHSGKPGVLNRWFHRVIEDTPLFGVRTLVHIEYAQVFINRGLLEVEKLSFVDAGNRVTNKVCQID